MRDAQAARKTTKGARALDRYRVVMVVAARAIRSRRLRPLPRLRPSAHNAFSCDKVHIAFRRTSARLGVWLSRRLANWRLFPVPPLGRRATTTTAVAAVVWGEAWCVTAIVPAQRRPSVPSSSSSRRGDDNGAREVAPPLTRPRSESLAHPLKHAVSTGSVVDASALFCGFLSFDAHAHHKPNSAAGRRQE